MSNIPKTQEISENFKDYKGTVVSQNLRSKYCKSQSYLTILIPSLSPRNLCNNGGSPLFSVVRGLSCIISSTNIGQAATASKASSSSI